MKKYTLFIIALLLFAGTWALAFCQSPKNEAQVVTVRTVAPGTVASISDKATINSETSTRGDIDMTNAMQNPANYTAEERAVYDVYRKFYTYKIDQNIQGLDSILDPNFRLVHMTGYSQPRAEWLSQVADGQMRYFSDVEERVIVHVTGDKATLQSCNKVDARIHGMRHVWNLELNFEMEKCNGEWIILEAIAHSY